MKPEITSQGDRELMVNMTILETWDETWVSVLFTTRQTSKHILLPATWAMLTVSDPIQIPFKTTHKDTGTQVNTSYYFIS